MAQEPLKLKHTEIAPGVSISQIGFGTAPIGGLKTLNAKQVEKEEGVDVLRYAMEHMGVNYFDSALLYGGGKALETLGLALGEKPRKDIVISFKVGRVVLDQKDPNSDPNAVGKKVFHDDYYLDDPHFVYDYSAEGVRKAFDQSMVALNRGRKEKGWPELKPEDLNIVVYVHDPDVGTHKDDDVLKDGKAMDQVMGRGGAFEALKAMQDQGAIKAFGVGTNEVGICLRALDNPDVRLMMLAGRGTLLCNGAPATANAGDIGRDGRDFHLLAQKIKSHPAKLVIASPGNSSLAYGGGTYNYRKATDPEIAFRDSVQRELEGFQTSDGKCIAMTDLAVRYPVDFLGDSLAAVVSGPRSREEAQQVVEAYGKPVPQELWQRLRDKGMISRQLEIGGGIVAGVGRVKGS